MKILLMSTSPPKKEAVSSVFHSAGIHMMSTSGSVDQPLGIEQTVECAKERLEAGKSHQSESKVNVDFVLAIENGIIKFNEELKDLEEGEDAPVCDFVVVALWSKKLDRTFIRVGGGVETEVPLELYHKISNTVTLGSLLHERDTSVPANDWISSTVNDCLSRSNQIIRVLSPLSPLVNVIQDLRTYPDFPRSGVLFRDVVNLLKNPARIRDICTLCKQRLGDQKFDYIVQLDARGFIFGSIIAHLFPDAGIIPIRKRGKLPGECYSVEYEKEYGSDVFEIQKDAIDNRNARILVVDDILATGGTAKAALQLLDNFPHKSRTLLFVDEVDGLRPDLTDERTDQVTLFTSDIQYMECGKSVTVWT